MKFSAIDAITNKLIAARFWMCVAILFAALAVASPYFTVLAMRAKEKVVILDPGGTLIYSPLLGFEEAGQLHAYHVRLACLAFLQRNPIGPDLSDLLKRLYLDPARKKAAALYQAQNAEFKEKQIHQKVEVSKIDILDTLKVSDGAGQSYEAVNVRAEGNLIRTGTVNKLEFREPVKFTVEFLFIRNPDLLANGRLPLVVQDFKYKESPLWSFWFRNFQRAADASRCVVVYLPMPGNGRRLTIGGIPPGRMLAAFPIKLAAVCAQVLFEFGALQASTNSSRRVGSCSCSANSRLASKTISSASFKFSRASSKVLPWVLTPGISSTQAAHQSSTCLYAAVSFMLISSLVSGSLSSRSRRTKSSRSAWMSSLSIICR